MKKLAFSFLFSFVIAGVVGCDTAPPIIEASKTGDVERVASLLASGTDINAADSEGATALYWATYFGRASIVRDLLAAGADPNIKTRRNSTPLEVAIFCFRCRSGVAVKGQKDIAMMLLEHGADVNVQSDDYGSSPLMLAAVEGHTEIVTALLEKGANTALTNHAGQTALISAAREGHVEVVKVLLAAGADANAKTPAGFSVLYGASMNGHDDIVRLLLKAGADPTTKDASVYYNRGLAYSNKGQYDRAIQDFDQAIRLNPQYARAYVNRGFAYDDQGQRDRAIQDYDQAIRLNPQDARVYNIRGLTYNDQGQYDLAIQDFDQAIRLNPQDADVYDNRGHAYARNGQDERAIKDFKMVFELSAGDLYTLLSLEVSARRLNRSESQFILDNTSSENLDEWPGIIVRHYLGQKTEADVFSAYAHETGKQKKDKDCEVYFYLGQIHLTNGKTEKAIEYFKKSLATEVTGFVEYTGSKAELQRLGVQ